MAVAAGMVYLTRGPSDVTVDQAVESYRSQPKAEAEAPAAAPAAAPKQAAKRSPAKAASSQPARAEARTGAARPAAPSQSQGFPSAKPGVYTFATTGYEETDALAGQRHEYPKETTLTVRRSDCGWVGRWQPLKERWEENAMCERPGGTEMVRYTMYHEFFRRGQTEQFACPGGFVQRPNTKAGDRWSFTCKSPNTTAATRVSVAGIETVVVGGRSVRAMHMHYDITASGANSGTLTQDRWITMGAERIMVRMTQKANLQTQSPFGKVGYKESFRLDLKSLDPRT